MGRAARPRRRPGGAALTGGPSDGPSHVTVGVDVGGTKTLGLLVEAGAGGRADVLERHAVPSDAKSPAVVDAILSVARRLVERGGDRVEAVGLGLAGFVDPDGMVRRAPNAAGLVGRDVGAEVAAAVGLPVTVDNDANCAALAARALLAPDARHVVAVTFGTGIGGGLVVDGRLVRGAHGFAGEPGHMVVDPDGPRCPCGQRGCWERYASGSGLGWLARRAVTHGRAASLLAATDGDVDALRGEHVTALFAEGDPGAAEVFAEYAGWIALGLANLVAILDPEVVVLGGGVSAAGDDLVERVREQLAERFPAAFAGRDLRLFRTPGGPEAGALGAALVAAGTRTGGGTADR